MLLDTYQQAAFDLLYKARTTQREAVIAIGERMADAIEHGGRVYLNAICHMIEHDLLNRGGGPAFYRHYDEGKTELKAGDVLFVSSVSGRTLPAVNLAWNAVEKGVIVIALTSMSYAQAVEPVHPSGKKLYEFATYTLDNCAP
ncbi:MAG: SIS domain-containing protein, partial [Clostridia bacterium]|nr:SIS domain-containing protein [Clostridia bacterium]